MGRNETWHTGATLWRKLRPAASRLRQEATEAEKRLWEQLRRRRLDGVRFRRQHPVDRFVVDFYAPAFRLAIELDGDVHDSQGEEDAVRDRHLGGLEVTVLRFRNERVFDDLEAVLTEIREALH